MSKLNINRLTNENEDGAPKITGISTFSSTAFFEPPKGTTAQRPEFVQPGMIRFNTDGGHLEYYNGVEWTEVLVANNTLDGGNRGVFAGGNNPPVNIIDYVTISTLGNAADFGDLTGSSRWGITGCSSSTRGLFAGGFIGPSSFYNIIEYVTISSTGNSADFGDLTQTTYIPGSCSSSTRGLFAGGAIAPSFASTNVISYVTIATTGDSVDFGDLTFGRAIGNDGGISDAHGGLGD